METVFPASGDGFSIECYSFPRSGTAFVSGALLLSANFVLLETIIQTKVKLFLIAWPLFYYWKPFSIRYVCIYIFLPLKAVFRCSVLLFIAYRSSFGNHY